MRLIQDHKAAWLEQLRGAKALAKAARKRIRYIGHVFSFWWNGPRVILVQQQGIQNVDEGVAMLQGAVEDLRARLRHHEHGPLLRSARALSEKRQRLQRAAERAAAATTPGEIAAAQREAAILAEELNMPDADITIDASNGQSIMAPERKLQIIEPDGGG